VADGGRGQIASLELELPNADGLSCLESSLI
jgi:hypothetical protein